MSKIKTRKEIAEELEVVQGELEAVKIKAEADLTTVNALFEDAQSQVEKLIADLAEANAGLENAIVEREEVQGKLDVASDLLEKALAEKDQAVNALENPAHQDAVNIVPTEIDQATEDAEADEQESDEVEVEPEATTLLEKYLRMEQGSERIAFWKSNKRELLKQFEEEEN